MFLMDRLRAHVPHIGTLAFSVAITVLPLAAQNSQPQQAGTGVVHMTAEQDRERMLGLVGLKESEMRPAPATDAKAANATNYDEAKADVYPALPDPLRFKDGRTVTTVAEWKQRSEEIRSDYDREILGRTPANLPAVDWHVKQTARVPYGSVDVVVRRISGHVDNSIFPEIAVNIEMILATPAKARGPVPVILELAFDKDYDIASASLDSKTPFAPGPWGVNPQPVFDRGWGFAILKATSVQADDGAGLTEGIIGLMNKGQPRSPQDWGALKAWAWGAGRALDYFETDKSVDAKRVGVAGHSRFGKAALVTMAYDPRFVIGYVSSSGEGGAKLYRHIYGEQIPNLTSKSLDHWFDGNFLRYGGPLTAGDLPVDNHELIALAAPRPLFIGGGADGGDGYANPNGDAWADPKGMFLAEVAAGPVYRLTGAKDLGTATFPAVGTAVMTGDLAWRQHELGHTPAPNWPAFLVFASRYLNKL